jgi:hypothetical protein
VFVFFGWAVFAVGKMCQGMKLEANKPVIFLIKLPKQPFQYSECDLI